MSFLVSLALAVVLTPAARWLGIRTGMVDRPSPDALKIHEAPMPVLGGVAVGIAALVALAVGRHLSWGVAGAVFVALVAGLIDDARSLPVWLRVNLLVGAGLLAAWVVPLEPLGAFAVVGTVLLVLACTNGVNLVDGQDGLASGLAALASAGLAVVASLVGGNVDVALVSAGALAGFLVWNRPPASIFLGNGGAYAAGTLLAISAASVSAAGGWRGFLAAGVCLGVFALELMLTIGRRLVSRTGLATGDRDHSYDLVAYVVGRTRTMLLFWGLGALAAGLGILIVEVRLAVGLVVVAAGIVAAGLLALRVLSSTRSPIKEGSWMRS